jgi:hypothetical protein
MGALPAGSRPKAGSATGLARWGRGWCDGSRTATGSGTTTRALPAMSRPKAGSATGLAQRCGVEGGGRGTERGGVDGAASREAATSREAAAQRGGKLEQPDGANQNFTAIRVLHRQGYIPYTRYVIGID